MEAVGQGPGVLGGHGAVEEDDVAVWKSNLSPIDFVLPEAAM